MIVLAMRSLPHYRSILPLTWTVMTMVDTRHNRIGRVTTGVSFIFFIQKTRLTSSHKRVTSFQTCDGQVRKLVAFQV